MKGKELVQLILKGGEAVGIPKGEIEISEEFMEKILNQSFPGRGGESGKDSGYAERLRIAKKEVLGILGADLVTVDLSGVLQEVNKVEILKEIEEWVREEDFFVFAMIGGVFWPICQKVGFANYCCWLKNRPRRLREEILDFLKGEIYLAQEALSRGAHGLIIADDLAYQRGSFLAPQDLCDYVFPYLKIEVEMLKKKGIPIFLHSCGDVGSLVEEIIHAGFDGLHGLQPSAGMDLVKVKEKFGERLTLMGNFEPERWDTTRLEELKRDVQVTLRACRHKGRYIASTSGGLSVASNPVLIKELYNWINQEFPLVFP